MPKPNLDHPTLPIIKRRFAETEFFVTEFRGETTLVVPAKSLHPVLKFLKEDPECAYDFLSDIVGIDYLNYPGADQLAYRGRFGVVYRLISTTMNRKFFIRVHLEPTRDTSGIEEDPALKLASVTDLWPGAEWPEREVYDMFGIVFEGHPDLRRILTWEDYPAHPLRKDYPLRGRGERETYRVIERDSA